VRRLAAHCKLEEYIIARVARCADSHVHLNPFRLPDEGSEEALRFIFSNVLPEYLSPQHFVDFRQHRQGEEHSAAV